MSYETLRDNLLELIRRTSTYLPPDAENVINLKNEGGHLRYRRRLQCAMILQMIILIYKILKL